MKKKELSFSKAHFLIRGKNRSLASMKAQVGEISAVATALLEEQV